MHPCSLEMIVAVFILTRVVVCFAVMSTNPTLQHQQQQQHASDPITLLQQHAKGDVVRSTSPGLANKGSTLGSLGHKGGVSDGDVPAPLTLHIGGNVLALKQALIYTVGSSRDAHVHLGG